MANNITKFMRRETCIDGNRQIVKPEFHFIAACADMNVSGLVAFVGIEKGAIRPPTKDGRHDAQYLFAIGNSSAGNSVITRQPLSVTTTSSSMRAAEKPSVAGQ